jgi:tetratricopeptide (TPR) repeat protein
MKKTALLISLIFISLQLLAQISLKDHNKAIKYYNEALKNYKKGSNNLTIENLKKSINIDSTYRESYVLMYHSTDKLNEDSVQKIYLRKANNLFTEDDEFYYYMGLNFRKVENLDSAIFYFTKAIDLSKVNGEDFELVYSYYSNRGICYLYKELWSKSLFDLNYSLKLDSTHSNVYTNRGIVLFKLNRKDEACMSWKTASEMGESYAIEYLVENCDKNFKALPPKKIKVYKVVKKKKKKK